MSTEAYRPALDDPNAWVPYRYHPSNVAAIVFVVAFSLTTLLHTFQLFKKKTWYFVPIVIGGLFQVIGYVGRILSHDDLWALGPFIMQSLLILIAPALFAASIYMILGRIIQLVDGERFALVPKKWLTKMFVMGDVISFLLQGAGGGIQAAGTLEALHTGEKLIIAGLFTQLFFFAFFMLIAGLFHYRLVNDKPSEKNYLGLQHGGTESSSSPVPSSHANTNVNVNANELPWKRHLYILYLTSGLIMVRSVFRVVEYLQGNAGYLLSHEIFLYIFDSVLMLAVMVVFNCVHPSGVTDAYQKRMNDCNVEELQRVRERYMDQDAV